MRFPIEALVSDFFRLGQVELPKQLVVAVRQLPRLAAHPIEPEQIADLRRRGEKIDQLRCIRRRAKTRNGMIAFRDFGHRAGRDIERGRDSFALPSRNFRRCFCRPASRSERCPLPARRAVVAEHAAADIPVEIASEIPRLRVFHQIEHPQIGLRVGIDRLLDGSDKSHLFSIRAERNCVRVHVDRRQFRRLAAARRDGIELLSSADRSTARRSAGS